MIPIKFDPMGILDVLAGILLLYTVSPLPVAFAEFHAAFLIFKGSISMLRGFPPIMPVYILGNAADIISAAILFTGQPPILAAYKTYIAGALAIKGAWGLLGMLSMG